MKTENYAQLNRYRMLNFYDKHDIAESSTFHFDMSTGSGCLS